MSIGSSGLERRHTDSEVFGFRADGEWLVIRERNARSLEEWSTLTNAIRPSDFAPLAQDATQLCISPDDVHLVATLSERGSTVVRSRTSNDETVLDETTFAPLPPSDCAFSPKGETFALAGEHHVAVYRLGASAPEAWLPWSNASHLSWSSDGRLLTFAVRDSEMDVWLVFNWSPQQGRLVGHVMGGPAVSHPRRPELLARTQCEWHRHATVDGKFAGRLGPAAQTCFHVQEDDIVMSPTGQSVAALEGSWGSRELVLLPIP